MLLVQGPHVENYWSKLRHSQIIATLVTTSLFEEGLCWLFLFSASLDLKFKRSLGMCV